MCLLNLNLAHLNVKRLAKSTLLLQKPKTKRHRVRCRMYSIQMKITLLFEARSNNIKWKP